MNAAVFNEVKNEMVGVNLLMNKSLHPWREQILPYLGGLDKDPHWHMIPAITALVHRSLGIGYHRTVYISTILRMAYLANHIHDRVRDDEEGQVHDKNLQFTILIGDYLFGVLLSLLSEIDSHYLVPSLAGMMAEVNEGHVIRKVNGGGRANLEVLAREKASFYKNAFLTAAVTARLSEREKNIYQEVGHNIGMALAIEAEGLTYPAVAPYLEKVKSLWVSFLRERRNGNWNLVERLVEELMVILADRRAAVV